MISDPYRAQRILPLWAQTHLQEAAALVIGVGGLGTPAALYLSAMGIGRLLLCDPDTIAIENLHRQPLYTPADLGQLKVHILAQHLQALRPDLTIEIYPQWADEAFLRRVGASAGIWIDGTDNLASRLIIDEVAAHLKKPWVYGAIFQWEGQVVLWDGLRYRDYFGEGAEGPSCNEAGVLGAIPGIIGSWQAALAAMYLAAPSIAPRHRLFQINLLTGQVETYTLEAKSFSPLVPETPLEVSLKELSLPSAYYWVDIREEPAPPLPFPHEHRPWYRYDQGELPRSQPVVLVCETGNRSRSLAFALRQRLRRQDIYSLRGGIQSLWQGYRPQS